MELQRVSNAISAFPRDEIDEAKKLATDFARLVPSVKGGTPSGSGSAQYDTAVLNYLYSKTQISLEKWQSTWASPAEKPESGFAPKTTTGMGSRASLRPT